MEPVSSSSDKNFGKLPSIDDIKVGRPPAFADDPGRPRRPKKRGPGRPRKDSPPPPSVRQFASYLGPVDDEPPPPPDDMAERMRLYTRLLHVEKELRCDGSGREPSPLWSVEELEEELQICYNQVNDRRGMQWVKGMTLLASYLGEGLVPLVVDRSVCDVRGLTPVVAEHWEALFREPSLQLAAEYGFSGGPVMAFAEAFLTCAQIANAKNKAAEAARGPAPPEQQPAHEAPAPAPPGDDNPEPPVIV